MVDYSMVAVSVGDTRARARANPCASRARARCRLRQASTLALCVWFALANTVFPVVRAQSGGDDFQAPVIEHEPEPGGLVGEIESFVANVVDNDRLDSVTLFHRYAGEAEFEEESMRSTSTSSFYSARIDTTGTESLVIEYYIRAEDASGNIALSGFAFEPLQRTLLPVQGAESAGAPDVTIEPARKVNWLYVGLGVLVLGGVAASLSGGGGDDNGGSASQPGAGCNPDCEVTLTVLVP